MLKKRVISYNWIIIQGGKIRLYADLLGGEIAFILLSFVLLDGGSINVIINKDFHHVEFFPYSSINNPMPVLQMPTQPLLKLLLSLKPVYCVAVQDRLRSISQRWCHYCFLLCVLDPFSVFSRTNLMK